MADEIIVRVRAEGTQEFIKQLKAAGIEVEKTGEKTKKTSDKMGKSFKKLGAVVGAAFATTALIAFGKELARTAVEIDATGAKVSKVFGAAAKDVDRFARESSTKLGLTANEFKKAAAAAGDLLIPIGFQRKEAAKLSADLVKLSGALSAWSGGQLSAAEVSNILTKALLGEREQLKQLGIVIGDADVKAKLLEKGQAKLTGTLLAQAKATATLELIYAKSTDAQDAFNDETVTLTESLGELSANIRQIKEDAAELFIPGVTQVTGFVARQIKFLRELIDLQFEAFNPGQVAQERFLQRIAGSSTETLQQWIDIYQKQIDDIGVLNADSFKQIQARDVLLAELRRRELETPDKDTLTEEELLELAKKRAAAEAAITKAKEEYFKNWRIEQADLKEQEEREQAINDLFRERNKIVELAPNVEGSLFDPDADPIDNILQNLEVLKVAYRKTTGEIRDDRIAKAQEAFDGISQIGEIGFNTTAGFIQAELSLLDNKYKQGLIGEKEYQKQRAELQEKQAKADKANAVFQATLNLATAITKSFAVAGGTPAGIAFAAIAQAAAAAQLVTILAQPIPQFAKGTKGKRKAPEGFAWVGEEGPELVQMKGGENVLTAQDSEELMRLLAGYSIPVQFAKTEDKLQMPLRSLKSLSSNPALDKIDWNPLLNASDFQRRSLGKKLDLLHLDLMKVNNGLTRRMTNN